VIPKAPQVLPHGDPPDFLATEEGRGNGSSKHTSYIPINTFEETTRNLRKQKKVVTLDEEEQLIAPTDPGT